MIGRGLETALLFGCLFSTSTAWAHLTLTSPPARHPDSDLKYGPCGVGDADSRTTDPSKITTYMAGETITVEWTEVIDHDPSHYRIAFSSEGDDFVDPTGFDDQETVFPELLDGIPDADGGNGHQYSVEVTLPNEPCDLCSLQVIQVMHDKPPWGPDGGDDIYYQCADIVILADPNDPDPVDPDPTDPPPTGVGGTPSGGSGGGAATGGGTGIGGTAPEFGTGGTDFGTGGTITDPSAAGGSAQPQGEPASTDEDSETQPACAMSPGSRNEAPWVFLLAAGAAWFTRGRKRGSSGLRL